MAPTMLTALFVMLAAFMLYGLAVTLARGRTIVLERERRADWAQEAALKGQI